MTAVMRHGVVTDVAETGLQIKVTLDGVDVLAWVACGQFTVGETATLVQDDRRLVAFGCLPTGGGGNE